MTRGQFGLMQVRIGLNDAPMHHSAQEGGDNAQMHEATRRIIQELMAQYSISSERQLALECQMSQSTLHRFLKGETETMEFHHLQAIAHRFSLTVSQLIGETPFEADPKVRVVAVAMASMPEYKKDVIVAASHSLAEPASDNGTTGGG